MGQALRLLHCLLPVDLHYDFIEFRFTPEDAVRNLSAERQAALEGIPVPIFIKDRYRIMIAELVDHRNGTDGEAQLILPDVQCPFPTLTVETVYIQ